MNIDVFYKHEVCRRIMARPEELNKRTGEKVRSVPGVMFRTDLELEGFPLLSLRKMPMSFIPEQMWFLSGENKIEWLSKHTKIWDSFAEENGTITSAYGYRWRHHFLVGEPLATDMAKHVKGLGKVDQLELVLNTLKSDPSSRHGVVMMWDPGIDLVMYQKNVPCPYTFTLMIIEDRLHLHLTVRSNDMVLGFPTDVAGFALLQMILAQKLGIKPGIYTHSISNAHVYSMHEDVIKIMDARVPGTSNSPILTLPLKSYERGCALDDSLIEEIKAGLTGYDPQPVIKGIKIAL